MDARLAAQIEVVTNALEKVTPREANESTLGVWTNGCPEEPRWSKRKSSATIKIRLGGVSPTACSSSDDMRIRLLDNNERMSASKKLALDFEFMESTFVGRLCEVRPNHVNPAAIRVQQKEGPILEAVSKPQYKPEALASDS